MKFYLLLIRYRFYLSIIGLLIALGLNLTVSGFWPVFPLYFIAFIGLLSHFLIGPLRLVQEDLEKGDMEGVKKIMDSIWLPQLLIKPIRSTYFTLKGNIAMTQQDFTTAEKHLKKSSDLGSPMAEGEGANKLQLAMISMQKGDMKQAESYLRTAIRSGLPDKESEAVAYLGMCQIFMQKREFRAAKEYFRKTKACKPKTKEVLDQVKELERYITRIPG